MVGRKGAHTDVIRACRTVAAPEPPPRRPANAVESGDGATAERPANPIDRYSLALQLLQVFPMVSSVVLVFVPVSWLARVLAAAVLVVGTVWVVWRERTRGKPTAPPADDQRADMAAAVVEALLNGPVATGEYGGEFRGVSISIRIHGSPSAAYRHHYRRRRLRELRSRPALPPPPRAALFRHEIRGQPEMTLRIVDDQLPDVH